MANKSESDTDETQFGTNDWLVQDMRRRWQDDPESVSETWRTYFDSNGERDVSVKKTEKAAPTKQPEQPVRPENDQPEKRAAQTPATQSAPVPQVPDGAARLTGISATIADRMDDSIGVPTATSFRDIPSKLMEVNRMILNNQLRRLTRDGKISFTHMIGWATVKALQEVDGMSVSYTTVDDKPHIVRHEHVNFGLAIDIDRGDGQRVLLVPNIKKADTLGFAGFWSAYEDIVLRARNNELTLDDYAGTTATLTNPGTIGTVQSVPRLMPDQGVIIGVGAITYPPEYQASDPEYLARQGIGRVVTLSSTYDHRVIQGAQSGDLLARIHSYLLGEDEFYEEIFDAVDVPYTPARWAVDFNPPIGSSEWAQKQANVFRLINAYRVRGHLIADLDPLHQERPRMWEELDPLAYGLTIWDLDRTFATGGMGGKQQDKLRDILSRLRDAYCRTMGIEFMHIQERAQKEWIQKRLEVKQEPMGIDQKVRILRKLGRAEAFELFLHTKFVGQKRFGLEGAESLIPLLDGILGMASGDGMEQAVMGMSHRGRLNVLANVIGKSYERIFREFGGGPDPDQAGGSGDVKYHLGASGSYSTDNGEIGVEVVANPSHLEAVDPVLEGVVRAKQEKVGEGGPDTILPILMHGDAAYAGQGVVVETHNLSQLKGYYTGGTVHVVINNQVGFTTSALDARSSFYATDVAKTVQAPIIHVNGDDPEAVVRAAELAFEFRQEFNKDVVIDLLCYRRRGHNEGDEPSYTQPVMYRLIDEKEPVRKQFLRRLVATKAITEDEGEELVSEFRTMLDAAFDDTKEADEPVHVLTEPSVLDDPTTKVEKEVLGKVLSFITTPPDGFDVHPKLQRILEERAGALDSDGIDWGTTEALALGTLAIEGTPIRLAGEDSRRGTFSQRHAELTDYTTAETWAPLEELTAGKTRVRIVDSLLSEFAAVGFEYGYSVESPEALVMWEAQYGDFANGAQVVVDQFIAAGWAKWGQNSGLAMLLPHGYEGQGPEHSSARIERYLDLCALDNLRVAIPSTSGQYFHLLRRQARQQPRHPLVVFTPKSLLRAKTSMVTSDVLTDGVFQRIIPDETHEPRRVVLCTGKVYYDLAKTRADKEIDDVALVRVEQLYPVPRRELAELDRAIGDADLIWCQEEPENMGAWRFLGPRLEEIFGRDIRYAGREAAGSPATGSATVHLAQQRALVEEALER
ncbi:MAG: multifunctional oxoglutarate decarboxylase/oxoglutarate dehydrogenase thiamine pyrophosphate-binding subunit/dihydrolipoyllysine-residue succinyltransferase subunit [Acidimicrobiia bacterium]|nr:multifunctional oxoglutarate decarboxylase/oxoglutarate dehydrogenase thiamine pyrophosphate-binding subunit/dihydrolipoyllysine-residue succinyltransferase subunit [Acidimicrobiia bacterium]